MNEEKIVVCYDCGEEIREDEATLIGGEYFCSDCEDSYTECRECNEPHLTDDMRYDRYNEDYVCDKCYDDEGFCTCEECGEILTDWVSVDGGDIIVCEGCADGNYYRCEECGEYFSRDGVYIDNTNTCVCDSCYDNGYITCESCERIVKIDNATYSEIRGGYYCDECYEEESEINDYNYKPSPDFYYVDEDGRMDYTCEPKENTLYLGVEIEIDRGRNKAQVVDDIHSNLDWTYCKEDGSLDNGIEIVSHPCTLDFHLQADYDSQFKDLISESWKGHDASTCGLHCHINRDFLGDTEEVQDLNIAKIILLVNNLWEDMKVFSRRTEEQLNKWAKRYGLIDGMSAEEEEQIVECCKGQSNRYYAVNIQNDETVEFRLFRSTLKTDTFKATLQFVSNICHLVKETSLKNINSLTILDILKYNEYEELKAYYIERGLLKEEE